MADLLRNLETVARRAHMFSTASYSPERSEHPFDSRNVFPHLPTIVRQLFDDGHFAQATFEACKFLDKEVSRHSGIDDFGRSLMMTAFNSKSPHIKLNPLITESDRNEQEGYRFMTAGATLAIRNPRGHEYTIRDDPDDCLDHLSFISMILRRLTTAGYESVSRQQGTLADESSS